MVFVLCFLIMLKARSCGTMTTYMYFLMCDFVKKHKFILWGFYENVNILVTDMFVHFSQAIIAFI